jgi:hypothetical protein
MYGTSQLATRKISNSSITLLKSQIQNGSKRIQVHACQHVYLLSVIERKIYMSCQVHTESRATQNMPSVV